MSWLPCVSSWATRIFGIAMRMTIQEVGTLVAVGARNSSRALPAKTSRSGQASRSATANVPSHDGIGLPPTVSQDCQLSSVFRVRLSREAGPHRVSGEESIGTGCAGRRFTLLATARSLSPRRPLSADPGAGHKTTLSADLGLRSRQIAAQDFDHRGVVATAESCPVSGEE